MPTEKETYAAHADQYERLVRREDWQGNILPAIERVRLLGGLDVIELGAGTGRLTRLLAPRVRSIRAFDFSAHMLAVARDSLAAMGVDNWEISVADHRAIPAPEASANLVISGWSFCYLFVWGSLADLDAGLAEARRVLRPGGTLLLIETLGTGHETPHPPGHLAPYYDWLRDRGFRSEWIRTDYQFSSLREAEDLARFFFGDAMAQQVVEQSWVRLPECTGLWRRGR